jgi:hypothetical protein
MGRGPLAAPRRGALRLAHAQEARLLDSATADTPRRRRRSGARRVQKKIEERVENCRRFVEGCTFEVWAQDEARIGLKPTTRRIWAERGKRPVVAQHIGYEWIYLNGFVQPATGEVEWLLLPAANIAAFNIALKHFAAARGASETKRILLVLDGAGWHKSKDVEWPTGVSPIFLPAYSPELQPAEKLWPLVREATANRFINNLDELEKILVDRCRYLIDHPEVIVGHTNFEWWPTDKDQ